jgi:L-alanine-DL-glutamate epimerase-like enolase superfamily enzyme
MLRSLTADIQNWQLNKPFRISRGVRTAIDVVSITLDQGGAIGRGECSPNARYGETAESALAQIQAAGDALRDGATREEVRSLMPAGAARNAVDCALWDLDAALGVPDAVALLSAPLPDIYTAFTVSLDSAEKMGEAAKDLRGQRLVKIKVNGEDTEACLRAVRASLPESRLIVDANEGWTMALLEQIQPALVELDIKMVEQPLPAAEDGALLGFQSLVPICADESCHVTGDVERLADRYGMVNIKLDKTGGLTEALDLMAAARARGMGVMVGCMMSTSLSIAPALRVAAHADYVDVDAPLWLQSDLPGGITLAEGGRVVVPAPGFWGDRSVVAS